MSTDVQRSSIEKQGSTDSQLEKRDTDPRDNVLDFGGDSTLPPPPKLTLEEEHKLYRKLDLRYVRPFTKLKILTLFALYRLMPILSLMYLLSFMDRGTSIYKRCRSVHRLISYKVTLGMRKLKGSRHS